MTPLDYDFLRKSLKERSGLVLSADKQYLAESRLLPVARKAGLGTLSELVAVLKRGNAEALMTAVVEAIRRSQSTARSNPPASAGPFTAAIVGSGHRSSVA